ncbi:putative enzyme related to lactoylglutathione lyase [Glaciihabitans tibetensis]|uniref:Putative enzyme related to lactoylglutathione lyase n=1 Tax=Glaciihabitans tibetensis TaxID=1266600 RepID=A0A2T0VGK2_9MICO|nr:VOC family protein [Glaciihabitans tibetensis]PRY69342.1 putative enzyme related to lactoylglutathione lyase [Glaciihabitans tibetensis]
MFSPDKAFSGYSVDDIAHARAFYAQTLGMTVTENEMGFLNLHLTSGGVIMVYGKDDHTPASYTVLNFEVDDIDSAVADLNARGVVTKIYDDDTIPTDAQGIARGMGPAIAWFTDPAGNVLSVLQPD